MLLLAVGCGNVEALPTASIGQAAPGPTPVVAFAAHHCSDEQVEAATAAFDVWNEALGSAEGNEPEASNTSMARHSPGSSYQFGWAEPEAAQGWIVCDAPQPEDCPGCLAAHYEGDLIEIYPLAATHAARYPLSVVLTHELGHHWIDGHLPEGLMAPRPQGAGLCVDAAAAEAVPGAAPTC